ncbi:2Fe-2S iron-sulfur cluster-binding protein [Actinoplanes sp. NPDC049265]|uniref:2Fe-2S iron-sulfur cluster-binding protein n=1 Tax=Actinoplanes sp. NPDC049265 TaxID=3363902 RepID=UPI003714D1D2
MSWDNLRLLSSPDEIGATIGRPPAAVMLKQVDRLDDGCRSVLAYSPIAGFGYQDAAGARRTTFVGGTPGFARVLSAGRFSFAHEEPVTGGVSFVFLLPGVGETLRLNGTVAGHDGGTLTIEVEEAYVHCARCVLRSQLWQPAPATLGRPASPAATDGPLGADVREFLDAAAFLVLSTGDAAGGGDTSPRGDRPGFLKVLGATTIAIPDRRGNQRADTLHNLLQDDRIALAALRPGRTEVLHLSGTAVISDDPELLATMAIGAVVPQAALLVTVADAVVARNAALARADLWNPARPAGAVAVPDMMAIATRHLGANRKGLPIGLLTLLSRPFRRLVDAGYRSMLRKEGYGPAPAPAAGPAGGREMRVVEVRRETRDAVTVVLADADGPARPVDFRPGQFFTLVTRVRGEEVRRPYSASSAPGSPQLEITVKRVGRNGFSGYANRRLRRGHRLAVHGPSGTFRAGGDEPELVLVAAGSGITPIMSIVRTLLAGPAGPRLSLLYGNRDEAGTLFAAELSRLRAAHPQRLTVAHRLTRPGPHWTGDRGRLDEPAVTAWLDQVEPVEAARYFLCGPDEVMRTVREVLARRGVDPGRIHQESYRSAAAAPAIAAGGPQRMTVENDGSPVAAVTVEPSATMLSAGLAAGAPMPYSCTVGTCGECVVKLRSGVVAMSEPNCLTERQRADGYVLTCVGRPQSEVTVDIAGS